MNELVYNKLGYVREIGIATGSFHFATCDWC